MSQNTMEDCKKGRARRKNPFNPNADGKRRATIIKRVHMARKRGERIEVTFDKKGQPEGNHSDALMSWIGVQAQEHCRTSSQFQQLSDRGSEIRTNNEYTSRGGRDGYRKLDQEKMEYNTQESQGTFESVGTSDVLTQALSRPEHPGRIRGQSKIKALVRGLCAKKDVESSFDQENVPTVDQHNIFKASCPIQEKQHGVSDSPTMSVDSQKCKLYIFDELHGGQLLVAFERAWLESLPTDAVH
ncbi:hypothetical protein TIFTF001_029244 [Ficus carica]|uniref:Uncharacterized protein n=1 Tax=Ficus carica TaxID=3494 RepID=A0AA88DRF5_FICCA|nr:hypothetical protein TIFTF001_029244 [Ficus carica]